MNERKVYVKVLSETDEDGNITPVRITWEDGRKYTVDKVIDVRRACAQKVGGTAIRYHISVLGKPTYLFNDDGKWFVESKQ